MSNPHPDYQRGLAALAAGDAHEAIEVFSRIIIDDARNADACFQRGKAQLMLQRRPQAIADFDAAVKLKPNNPEYRCVRAAELIRQKQFTLSIEDCEFVLASQPQRADVIFLRGQCRLALGDTAAALADFDAAAALDPANADIPKLKAALLRELGQFEEIAEPPLGV